MAPTEEMHTAMVNRSIRAIKAELEFLTDASIITPQTLSSILSQIPPQTALHAPISVGAVPTASPLPGAPQPPTAPLAATSLHEKQPSYNEKQSFSPSPAPSPAPPAYHAPPPSLPPLCTATALYAYAGEDAGDLDLRPNDTVQVSEYMNAEWWKGYNSRTGATGIFPRSYVRVEEKAMPAQGQGLGNNYGNMPLEQSGMGNGTGQVPGKGEEMGKKFGKKLGNAAIFGAGATIGGKIVNGIF
ncbi:hypothetical protein KVT40_008045 [Elsinoe batatas]|uniref:SH3 domain-containing protein n=1 Tax=Elsinoe batatas TaxID=2601811 RepID=A0A8K0PEZ9_9PEZI|nr:hypothetical protein KVT40_008045 [Elsinoe batatas]